MAENLNYYVAGSRCYNDNSYFCDTYGRLYDLAAITAICPMGWHLPSDSEWNVLMILTGGSTMAGRHLKATSGWDGVNDGDDAYGFTALPGGNYSDEYGFYAVRAVSRWWSSDVRYWGILSNYLIHDAAVEGDMFSVRCVQD
jgi:uncharacterized protein (TIGR02145 family)